MLRLYGALIGLSLIWGLSFVFMKWLRAFGGLYFSAVLRVLFFCFPSYGGSAGKSLVVVGISFWGLEGIENVE